MRHADSEIIWHYPEAVKFGIPTGYPKGLFLNVARLHLSKKCGASPGNLTWFTRQVFLVRLGMMTRYVLHLTLIFLATVSVMS